MSSLVQIRNNERLNELYKVFKDILPPQMIEQIALAERVENTQERIYPWFYSKREGRSFRKYLGNDFYKTVSPSARAINHYYTGHNRVNNYTRKYIKNPSSKCFKCAKGVYWKNFIENPSFYTDDESDSDEE